MHNAWFGHYDGNSLVTNEVELGSILPNASVKIQVAKVVVITTIMNQRYVLDLNSREREGRGGGGGILLLLSQLGKDEHNNIKSV